MKVGTITLRQRREFTQYSESAAWTDYVTCEPQTVELRYLDNYWLCAKFDGILTRTTFPRGSRTVGSSQQAYFQTQAFGVQPESELFSIEITNPDFAINRAGEYSNGSPMFAVQRIPALVKGGAL